MHHGQSQLQPVFTGHIAATGYYIIASPSLLAATTGWPFFRLCRSWLYQAYSQLQTIMLLAVSLPEWISLQPAQAPDSNYWPALLWSLLSFLCCGHSQFQAVSIFQVLGQWCHQLWEGLKCRLVVTVKSVVSVFDFVTKIAGGHPLSLFVCLFFLSGDFIEHKIHISLLRKQRWEDESCQCRNYETSVMHN